MAQRYEKYLILLINQQEYCLLLLINIHFSCILLLINVHFKALLLQIMHSCGGRSRTYNQGNRMEMIEWSNR